MLALCLLFHYLTLTHTTPHYYTLLEWRWWWSWLGSQDTFPSSSTHGTILAAEHLCQSHSRRRCCSFCRPNASCPTNRSPSSKPSTSSTTARWTNTTTRHLHAGGQLWPVHSHVCRGDFDSHCSRGGHTSLLGLGILCLVSQYIGMFVCM